MEGQAQIKCENYGTEPSKVGQYIICTVHYKVHYGIRE